MIAKVGPHLVTMILTLVVASLLFFGINTQGFFERPRSQTRGPLFFEATRPAPGEGEQPVNPRSFPEPPGERLDPSPRFSDDPALSPQPGGTGEVEGAEVELDPAGRGTTGFASTGFDLDEQNTIRIYENANRAVVNVSTSATVRGLFQDTEVSGSGSGFVINRDGYILTNHHVVEGAQSVQVGLFDGSVLDARVVGVDPSNDVAVIQAIAPPGSLVPLTLGESSDLRVGQKVLALGNPFGLERTLTTGIISSLDRSLEAKNGRVIRGIIQTDASINPGNSGGPLLNSRGEVIGMNTAIYSKVGQSSGIGFAVPISLIKRILRPLIEQGFVERATLGIARVYATDEGLVVLGVEAGSPANQAGIRPLKVDWVRDGPFVRARIDPNSADLILAINGVRVRSVGELLTEVESYPPGETITITVRRNGQTEDVSVRLGRAMIR